MSVLAGPAARTAPARPTFHREPFSETLLAEALPLLRDHWREIAHYPDIPLEIDADAYRARDAAGGLRLFTIRGEAEPMVDITTGEEGDYGTGELLGYAVFFLARNAHYRSSLQALQDVVYLKPGLRGRMTGARFLRWCDDRLREEGVQVVAHHIKAAHPWGRMLERMGYELVDLIYTRRLDAPAEGRG